MQKLFCFTAAGLVVAVGSVVGAHGAPVKVVLSGDAAPSGGAFGGFGAGPVLNDAGQVAFVGGLPGGPAPAGVFLANSPASIQDAALEGTHYPTGGVVSSLTVNASGKVAFLADPFNASQGLYAGTPGSVAAIATSNGASPAGGVFNVLFPPVQNGAGQIAFQSTLFNAPNGAGVFLAGPTGAVQSVALSGTAAPGLAGNNYNGFDTRTTLNAAGQVAFFANLSSGSVPRALFVGAPGSLQPIPFGAAAPGGGTFNTFTSPTLNDAGQIAFTAGLSGGSSSQGIFAGAPGSLQAVARLGTAAPVGGSVSFNNFPTGPVINGAGEVAFIASLFNTTTSQLSSGVFVGTPGSLQPVAVQGTAAPGGGTFSFLDGLPPVLNDAGQVAFITNLTGAGVNSTNDTTLFAGAPGELLKIVREGDLVDVDPGAGTDNRTVAAGGISFLFNAGSQDGRGLSFNDDGLIVYGLSFTDGSSGVFTSLVPEPAGLTALAAGLGLAMRRARRNR